MPTLFVFLFKVNIALLLFCAGYYLVLRHLTFYSLNRVYLITAIIFASFYPKIDLTSFLERHENIAIPVQTVVLNWQIPAEKLVKPLAQPMYWQWVTLLFWAGAALLAIRLIVQLFSLLKLYRRSKPAQIMNHDVRLMTGQAAPFSFWRSIYVNPDNHTPADLKAILLHEQVHVNGWHTLDILLAELSIIFYWFNPGVWLMKRAVRENIEFITDRKILNNGIEAKAYQYSLVNVSFNSATPGIVNHFNISTIKKRIIMMNAKRSSRVNLTRYAFVVPAVALLLVFSFSKAAITKPMKVKLTNTMKPITIAIQNATTSVQKATADVIAQADTVINIKLLPSITISNNNQPLTITNVQRDTIYEVKDINKADTGKKNRVIIRGSNFSNLNSIDSANFVVDGKRVKPADFKTIDPTDIMAVNIVDAGVARALALPGGKLNFENDNKVVFVTTKNSDAGKKLLEHLPTGKQITNLRIFKDGVPQNISGMELAEFGKPVTTLNLNAVRQNLAAVGAYTDSTSRTTFNVNPPDGLKEVVVKGYPTLKLKGTNALKEVTVKGYGAQFYKPSTLNSITVTGYPKGAGALTIKTVPGYNSAQSSVNRISDKLVVIDGKEASEKELKKLSAFDIDRMVVSSNADTVKKYGQKAKYGVVYIYTKKGK